MSAKKSPTTKKRGGGADNVGKKQNTGASTSAAMQDDELVFDDPYADEYEEEMVDEEGDDEDEDEEALIVDASDEAARARVVRQIEEAEMEDAPEPVWDPRKRCPEGQAMEHDPNAYRMLHRLAGEWPCLSFDFLPDEGGGGRTRFPHSLMAAAGTQADEAGKNKLTLMWFEGLGRMDKDESDDESDDDDDDEDAAVSGDPIMEHASFEHPGCVNRVASSQATPGIVATWSEDGHVRIWDARDEWRRFCAKGGPRPAGVIRRRPAATGAHAAEGYALKWSKLDKGALAAGDNSGDLKVWQFDEGRATCTAHYKAAHGAPKDHASVEDVAFSPTELTVMMSASSDASVAVFDVRNARGPMLALPHAHDGDVNGLTWNCAVSYLVATGGDDGVVKVWDLRTFGPVAKPVGRFDWHRGHPIAALEWDPHDESSLAVAAADHTATLWDLSVEDASNAAQSHALDTPGAAAAADLPPQLLFIHQGLTDPKDVKHHPQIPNLVMTTAADGFNLFIAAL